MVGPGSYLSHSDLNAIKNYAPFNTKEERAGIIRKEKHVMPGPGAYQVEQNIFNDKIVAASANSDIKIMELPKQQANFKSVSKR